MEGRKNGFFLPIAIDAPITVFVVGTGVVAFWRGSWIVLDTNLIPDNFDNSVAVSWALGSCTLMAWFLVQAAVHEHVKTYVGRVARGILERVTTYCLAWATVLLWRGIWYALDIWLLDPRYAGLTLVKGAWISHIMGIVTLFLLMVGRCLFAPPAGIFWDDARAGFVLSSWSDAMAGRAAEKASAAATNTSADGVDGGGLDPTKIATAGTGAGWAPRWLSLPAPVDAIFSVNVVGFAVVAYWRGSWQLLDHYVFPDSFQKSAYTVYFAGTGFLVLYYYLQLSVDRLLATFVLAAADNRHQLPPAAAVATAWRAAAARAVAERLVTYVVANAVVCIWRGVWYSLDVFLTFPQYGGIELGKSGWATHACGAALLLAMLSFRSALAPPAGIFYDDTESGFLFTPWSYALAERSADSGVLSASVRAGVGLSGVGGKNGGGGSADSDGPPTEVLGGEEPDATPPLERQGTRTAAAVAAALADSADYTNHHHAHGHAHHHDLVGDDGFGYHHHHHRPQAPPDSRRSSRILLDIADENIAAAAAAKAAAVAAGGSGGGGRSGLRFRSVGSRIGSGYVGSKQKVVGVAEVEMGPSRRGSI